MRRSHHSKTARGNKSSSRSSSKLLSGRGLTARKISDMSARKISGIKNDMVSYVKKNPLKTVGMSLLAGALISGARRFRK